MGEVTSEFDSMSDEQMRLALASFDSFAKASRETADQLLSLGVDRGVVRSYSIPTKSYEMADRMEEELRRREKAND